MRERIPTPEVVDSDFGEFQAACIGPVQLIETEPRDLLTADPHDMDERELLVAIVLELRAARQEQARSVRRLWP